MNVEQALSGRAVTPPQIRHKPDVADDRAPGCLACLGAPARLPTSQWLPAEAELAALEKPVTFKLLSNKSFVAELDGVFDADECAAIIEASEPCLEPSAVSSINRLAGLYAVWSGFNTSTSASLMTWRQHPLADQVIHRFSQVTGISEEYVESIRVINYQPGQRFRAHWDFTPRGEAAVTREQRAATLLVYLNDVQQGGQTEFPLLSLKVAPAQGRAVYFEYFNHGRRDYRTLHRGLAPQAGPKWVIQAIFHDKPRAIKFVSMLGLIRELDAITAHLRPLQGSANALEETVDAAATVNKRSGGAKPSGSGTPDNHALSHRGGHHG